MCSANIIHYISNNSNNVLEFILNLFYPEIIKSFPSQKGKLFFTFDDGPNPEVTPLILDILEQFNAKATFFCLGENVEKNPELIKEIINRGHSIGNHSYNHIDGFKTSISNYLQNVEKASKIISSNLFRPPYGRITPFQYHKLKRKFRIIVWNSAADDWNKYLTPEKCIRKVMKNAKDGAIILMHDNIVAKERVTIALPFLLEYFSKLGYGFEKIQL